jgi:hypothetical protein
MSAYNAQQHFKTALGTVNPHTDPAMWNLINGLVELAQTLAQMEHDLSDVKNATR